MELKVPQKNILSQGNYTKMVLNDKQIKHMQESGLLRIDPFQLNSLSPASYDLSLGAFQSINMLEMHRNDLLENDGFVEIYPAEVFLASTVEVIGFPKNITGEIVNKSSTSRKGLFLASTGWIDPGFVGQLTVVLKNESMRNIKLQYGQKLWQLIFEVCEPAEQAYQGHYQHSEGIVEDRSGDETIEF